MCTQTHTYCISYELTQKTRFINGRVRGDAECQSGGKFQLWTQVAVDKSAHNCTKTQHLFPWHTLSHKVHHSPLRNLFISDLWHKSHGGMQAYLSTSLETQRSPQRAPQCSTCHFQLVPQRESSATKRKMGAHYWIPDYSQLWNIDQEAMFDLWGPGCATCRPCHTSPGQMSAECHLTD